MARKNNYRKSVKSGSRYSALIRSWSILFKLLLPAAALVAISFALVWGYKWAISTEYFALREIEVQGARHLNKENILDVAGISEGQNLLGLSLPQVESRLSREHWVQKVQVKRTLPDRLLINIKEHEAYHWILKKGQVFYANQKGQPIAPVKVQNFVSLPLLVLDRQSERQQRYLADIQSWIASKRLPFSWAEISWLKFSSAEVLELHLQERDLLIRVGTEYLQRNLSSLVQVWRTLQGKEQLDKAKRFLVFEGLCWVKF